MELCLEEIKENELFRRVKDKHRWATYAYGFNNMIGKG